MLAVLCRTLSLEAQTDACRFVWSPANWRLLSGYSLRLYSAAEDYQGAGQALVSIGWGYEGYKDEWDELTIIVNDPSGDRARSVTEADPAMALRNRFNKPMVGPELESVRRVLSADPFPDATQLSDEAKHRIISQAAFISYFSGTSPYFDSESTEEAWAYDSHRRVLVIFNTRGQTWEWDGTAWGQNHDANRPSMRDRASMIYDKARGVCVLFGGVTGDTLAVNDLWEYDGAHWLPRQFVDWNTTNQPSPTARALLAYDEARQRTVLVEFDTWEWDGSKWFHLKTPGPFQNFLDRAAVVLAYDPTRRVTMLFEGTKGETWTWDGSSWKRMAIEGPPPRKQAGMAFDLRRKVMVLFGGRDRDGQELADSWEWDGASWSLVPEAGRLGVRPRLGSKMWYDPVDARLVMFGGEGPGLIFSDLWEARPAGLWLDFNAPDLPAAPEKGFFYAPFRNLEEAVASATPGCTLNLKAGSSPVTLTITKPLTLDAFYGPVTLGRP